MSLYPKCPSYFGVESSTTSFKTAAVCKTRRGWKISHLKEIDRTENVNPLYNSPKECVVVSSFASKDMLVKNVEVAAKKEKDVFSALEFHVEPLLSFPIETAIVEAEILERKESSTALSAFIVKKDHLQKHLHDLPFVPERITAAPIALAAFSKLITKASMPTLWIHIGKEEITCALVQQGNLLAARAFDNSAEPLKEIQKTILRFESSFKTRPFETIFLLGENAGLATEIQNVSGKTVLFPASAELPFSQEELMRFGLSIGIALAGQNGPNFRKNEFAYPYPFKRLKKPLISFFILAALFFSSLFGWLQISISQQKHSAQTAFSTLLAKENKKESAAPNAPDDYLAILTQMEREIQSKPDTFPLYPLIPRVKDVLAWLSSVSQELGARSPIEIQTFHYALVKRPDFSHKKERYKVKVEFEFTAENASDARAFHDILAAPNLFVDPKEELKWSTSKGKYRAEFFLKDKTRYH